MNGQAPSPIGRGGAAACEARREAALKENTHQHRESEGLGPEARNTLTES